MTSQRRWVIGAHTGASAYMRHASAATTAVPPLPLRVVDVVRGRSAAFLQQWSRPGVPAGEAIEAQASEVLDRVGPDDDVVVAVDTLHAMRDAITHARHAARVSAQIVGRSPGHRGAYFGLAMTIRRDDTSAREQADLLLAALETVSADRTSSRVLMESGDALAPALLIPLRERVAAWTAAASAGHDEPHHALTFVVANGDYPLAVVPRPMGVSLAAQEEAAIRLTHSWTNASRMAVAFANAGHAVDILLLDRNERGAPAVIGMHSFDSPAPGVPLTTVTD